MSAPFISTKSNPFEKWSVDEWLDRVDYNSLNIVRHYLRQLPQ